VKILGEKGLISPEFADQSVKFDIEEKRINSLEFQL
jgi:hypothetical protein